MVLSSQSSVLSSTTGSLGEGPSKTDHPVQCVRFLGHVELKVKELDPDYPPVHSCTWLNIQIVKHAFDVTGIDFHP